MKVEPSGVWVAHLQLAQQQKTVGPSLQKNHISELSPSNGYFGYGTPLPGFLWIFRILTRMTCNLNLQLPRLAWSCRQGPEVRSEAPKGVNPTLWFMYLKLSRPPKQPPMSFITFPYTLGFFLRDRVPANFQTFDLIELRWLMRFKYLPQ